MKAMKKIMSLMLALLLTLSMAACGQKKSTVNNSDNPDEIVQNSTTLNIMILHKVPTSKFTQKKVYYYSKFVTLYALSQRNWRPKSKGQSLVLKSLKILPCKALAKMCYKKIYKYDGRTENFKYCYWITPAKFRNGLFDADFFSSPVDVPFEDTVLMGSEKIKEYLEYRYGDYMKLPSEEQQRAAVHAMIYDTQKDYREYLESTNV